MKQASENKINQKETKSSLRSTIFRIAKKIPGDIIHKNVKVRERHINSLLDNFQKLQGPEVKIMDEYLNIHGKYCNSLISLFYSQKIFLPNEIGQKYFDLRILNDNYSIDQKNTVKVMLNELKGFNLYLKYCNDFKILNELTLDAITIQSGKIIFSSTDKLDITIKEDYINKLIKEELLGKYGIKDFMISLKDGFINIKGHMIKEEFDLVFNKNIKIKEMDLYHIKQIEFELDEQNQADDKLEIKLYVDHFEKIKENKIIRFFVNKIIMNRNRKLKCDQKEASIIIY